MGEFLMSVGFDLSDPRAESPVKDRRPPVRRSFDPLSGNFPGGTRPGGTELLADPRDGEISEIVLWPSATGA
ncbi:MAG: hypothetical protein AAF501_21055 [Pseudomonadota bacterium]